MSALVKRPFKRVLSGELWLARLIDKLAMKPLAPATGAYCNDPGNRGLTILQPITTSHIALHIWDEPNPAHLELDVYSCKQFDPQLIFDHLQILDPTQIKHCFFDRTEL